MTKRTDTINSIRQLAAAIGRSPATALTWTRHEAWPYARHAPWDAADAEAMIAWADEHLRRDREEDSHRIARRERDDATAGFWSIFNPRFGTPVGVPSAGMCDHNELPDAIVTPIERSILAGDPLPSDDVVRAIVLSGVRLRGRAVGCATWLPRWLRGQTADEMADRIAAAINEPAMVGMDRINAAAKPARRRQGRP